MKRFILLIALILCSFTLTAQSNTYKVNEKGELVAVTTKKKTTNVKTKYTVTKSGVKYPVWRSSNNKYFIVRKSKKTGAVYKQYLKIVFPKDSVK